MIQTIKFVVSTIFFLVLFGFVLAPALNQTSDAIEGSMSSTGPLVGLIDTVETALFLGMPLLLLGGIILVGLVVASGLRGTSR
jgi:hypothetical protein